MSAVEPGGLSLLLLSFNQQSMVRAAALACLAQQGGPYEIVFSDDASTDDTFAELQAVAATYAGPHRLRLRRNAVNVGIGEHYNQLVEFASGALLVTAAGDDLSLPQRMSRIAAAWDATGRRADLIASHLIDLDHAGRTHDVIRVDDLGAWRGVDDWLAARPYIVGAGHAFTRRMMQRFGPFADGIAYEDQIMVFRAIASGGALTVDEPLVHYRRGGTSALPRFDTALQMQRWRDRQSDREFSEAVQLVADARIAGCEDAVRASLAPQLAREGYKHDLRMAGRFGARWRLFMQAHELPLGWRFRKLLHVVFPWASYGIKRNAAKLHRRSRR